MPTLGKIYLLILLLLIAVGAWLYDQNRRLNQAWQEAQIRKPLSAPIPISESSNTIPASTREKVSAFAQRINVGQNQYEIFQLDLSKYALTFHWRNDSGKVLKNFKNLKDQLNTQSQRLTFATNGGMFHADYQPVGLYVENGREISPLNLGKGRGNFFMKPNGVFYILQNQKAGIVASPDYVEVQDSVQFATQSGPLLVHRGRVHPKFKANSTSKYIRSGVGMVDNDRLVFAISVQPVNFYEFAKLFQEKFQCQEALYLDGNISKMYLPALNRYDSTGRFGVIIALSQ